MSEAPSTPTPPFVLWALEADCIYREEAEPSELERTERILRPLRASAEALSENRCLNDVCINADWSPNHSAQQTTGFVLSDTLIPFGGQAAAEQTCGNCPANVAMPPTASPRWAGCHGMLIASDLAAIEQRLQVAIDNFDDAPIEHAALPMAASPWYRLWIDSPLSPANVTCHSAVWERFGDDGNLIGLAAYLRALQAASVHELKLHVKAFPTGTRSRKHWQVPAHCPRCSAPREETSHACPVCQTTEGAAAARRRMAKGERPYWQLTRFMGVTEAEAFLGQYLDQS